MITTLRPLAGVMRPMNPAAAVIAAVLATTVPRALAAQVRDTLTPIVVTATRSPAPAATLAASATVLEGEDLRRAGVATVADALRSVPGVALAQAGSWGAQTSLFLRGGESDHVRVLLDGVPVNQAGGFLDLADLATENVERIEIVRGPASVLYGSEAVTGVVQVITRRGRSGRRASLAARGGAYGTGEIVAGASGAGARFAISAGAGVGGTDGVEAFNNAHRRQSASARVLWTPDAATDVDVSVRARRSVFHYPTDGSGAAVDSNQVQRRRAAAISVDAGRQVTRALALRLLVGLHVQADSVNDAADGPADTLGIWSYESGGTTSRASADVRASLRAAGAVVVTVGASIEQQREVSHNSYASAFGPGGGTTDVERTGRALYAQALAGRGRLSFQGGLRVDDSRTFGGFGTWRAGVSYQAAPAMRVRAAAGTAFKEPTFGEIYSTGFSIGNPALRPERGRSWEIGLERRLAGWLNVSATWFDQRFRDLIQYTFVTAGPADPNYYNVAAARSRGLEVELAATPAAPLSARLSYGWLGTQAADSGFDGAVFAEGRRLLRRPTHTAALSAEWRAAPSARVGVRILGVGSRDDLDFSGFPAVRVTLPAHARLDAWGTLALRGGEDATLALTLRVENATGADIREVHGFRTPGRRLLAGFAMGVGR